MQPVLSRAGPLYEIIYFSFLCAFPQEYTRHDDNTELLYLETLQFPTLILLTRNQIAMGFPGVLSFCLRVSAPSVEHNEANYLEMGKKRKEV
jgi:hypothetical protein